MVFFSLFIRSIFSITLFLSVDMEKEMQANRAEKILYDSC